MKCPWARLWIPSLHTHTLRLDKILFQKCGERNAVVKSGGFSGDEHASGRLMFVQAAPSAWRAFQQSGRREKKSDASKTLLTFICGALDRKVSKQSPGAGAFWWTKLPAWRLRVSQVNKTQRRERGGRREQGGGQWECETEEQDRCKLMVVLTDQRRCLNWERKQVFSICQVWSQGVLSNIHLIYYLFAIRIKLIHFGFQLRTISIDLSGFEKINKQYKVFKQAISLSLSPK